MTRAPQLAKRQLGYAHPPERLPGLLTGRQCLEVYATARELADFGADVLELAEGFRMTVLLDQFVDTYSLGTRQKLSVLLVLMSESVLVVLDGAFNGLDPRSALILKRYLQERVAARLCAVVLATHASDIVLRYSTRAALLQEGRLARSWTVSELQSLRAGSLRRWKRRLPRSKCDLPSHHWPAAVGAARVEWRNNAEM